MNLPQIPTNFAALPPGDRALRLFGSAWTGIDSASFQRCKRAPGKLRSARGCHELCANDRDRNREAASREPLARAESSDRAKHVLFGPRNRAGDGGQGSARGGTLGRPKSLWKFFAAVRSSEGSQFARRARGSCPISDPRL